MEHTRAGDAALLALASLCLVLIPWNAPLWWNVRRLRHAVEIDCDTRVLRGTPDAAAYGELLLDVGERASLRWSGVAAFGDSSSFLAGRIRNILAPAPRAWRLFAGTGICVMGLFLVAACEMPPTSLRGTDPAPSSRAVEAEIEVPAAVGVDTRPGDPSLVHAEGQDDPPAASSSLVIVSGGRPNADNLRALVHHLRPEMIANGLDGDTALWVAVDASGGIRKSWVGPKLIFDVLDEYQPRPYLSLPEGNPARIAYEAHLREKASMLQQNVPDLQIRSEIFLGFVRFVSEAPGRPLYDGIDGIHMVEDLTVRINAPSAN